MSTTIFDNPLAMNYFDEETNRHYFCIYDNMKSAFYNELSTVWKSMYEKGLRKNLGKQHSLKRECDDDCTTQGEHESACSGELDLARVHRERALDAGKLSRDRGRRWRKRNYKDGRLASVSSDSSSQSC
ncbi:predicted protein [Nematostella vectensis]|uniref:Uncharacterized protein n=1 Tax=Nematostella vectensis TaxID=45351 RepID=A7RHC9_NEMVE|nr:predicted protein [Nematostella vectensis]|eukprot:XP_001641270.1 predicted protein [Nematostella vectensis]